MPHVVVQNWCFLPRDGTLQRGVATASRPSVCLCVRL